MSEPTSRPGGLSEELNVRGAQFADKVRDLFEEGRVRNVVIKREGRVVAQFPLLIGLVVAVLVPWLAALGLVAALVTESSIEVARTTPPPSASA